MAFCHLNKKKTKKNKSHIIPKLYEIDSFYKNFVQPALLEVESENVNCFSFLSLMRFSKSAGEAS